MTIVVDAASLRPGHLGPATGTLWVELGELQFPERGWNDFVIVLLEAWARSLICLVDGSSARECLGFMEGPYEVAIALASPDEVRLSFVEMDVQVAVVQVPTARLVEDLRDAVRTVLQACRKDGTWSADALRLEQAATRLETYRLPM